MRRDHIHRVTRALLPVALVLFGPAQAKKSDKDGGGPRDVTITTVNYTDPYDGTLLMGYYAVPEAASSHDPRPAAVIFPDWDGVNEYEKIRAEMLASELGYVAMAADVYGLDNHQPESFPERIRLTSLYRGNITLSNARVKAAVDFVKGLEVVDASRGVAVIGYCFGGTVVLNNALSGVNNTIATIAFHGGLTSVAKDMAEPVKSKVLIFSGGEDDQDSTKSVVEMEAALNAGNSTWELDRYSDVEHGFTKFDSRSYNPYVDERSWESTKRFLREVFGELTLKAEIPKKVKVQPVAYVDVDGAQLEGYVSYPSRSAGDKVASIVIIHDANGIDEYEQTRAQMLSDLGYVAFASDIYGNDHGYDLTDSNQRFELVNSIRDDVLFFVQRIRAAVDKVKTLERVDPANIAIIGYCFGGTGAINYAMVGESDAKAIVSFHGGLSAVAPVSGKINVKMLIQSGGDDDASSSIEELEAAMEAGNATWEYARYSDVQHSFTNWNDSRGRYNLRADVRSWESMKTFFEGAFDATEGVIGETKGSRRSKSGMKGRRFTAKLTGDQEVPPVETHVKGDAKFRINTDGDELTFKISVEDDLGVGLFSADTGTAQLGAHLHCGDANMNGAIIATLAGYIPNGLKGKIKMEGTLTDENIMTTDCGVNIAEVAKHMRDQETYVNVHSADNMSGEVRGNISEK